MNKINVSTIVAITSNALIANGLITMPTTDNQAHVLIFKDQTGKVKNLVKSIIGELLNRAVAVYYVQPALLKTKS